MRVEFETTDEIIRIGNRDVVDVNAIFDEETVDRIAKGYLCLKCFEPQETAFPDKCVAQWCRYPMKAQQALDFLKMFQGKDKHSAERMYDQEELDERAREKYLKDELRKKGVVFPGDRL